MKKYSLIFLCMFLPYILYAETTSNIIDDVKIILDTGTWVPIHSLDVLESKNRNYMSNFVSDIESFNIDIVALLNDGPGFDPNTDPEIVFWYEKDITLEPIRIGKYQSDDLFRIGSHNKIIILDVAYVGNMVKFTGKVDEDNNYYSSAFTMLDWSKLTENETFDMVFIFDGDYLHIYIDEVVPENLFYTFACIDDATVNEFKTLMSDNTCDLSNVTWPRYADGTSDYDDRIILNDTVGNHEVGKNYLTTDNLRFREKEGVAGEPLFTLPKDAPVKVLKLGTTELIDNITADWLQIEVAEDTIDTQGAVIKKGAVGWCFGGYVTTTPEIVVEEPKEVVPEIVSVAEVVPKIVAKERKEALPEIESTEKNATAQGIPLSIWLLIGGGVLLVGAIVAIVVVRKKKN